MHGNLEDTDTLGVGCDCASFSEAGGHGFLAEGGLCSVTQSSSKEDGQTPHARHTSVFSSGETNQGTIQGLSNIPNSLQRWYPYSGSWSLLLKQKKTKVQQTYDWQAVVFHPISKNTHFTYLGSFFFSRQGFVEPRPPWLLSAEILKCDTTSNFLVFKPSFKCLTSRMNCYQQGVSIPGDLDTGEEPRSRQGSSTVHCVITALSGGPKRCWQVSRENTTQALGRSATPF